MARSTMMLRNKLWLLVLVACWIGGVAGVARADTLNVSNMSEDFTGASTTYSWYFYNGACLTASAAPAATSPGTPPGCTADGSYYQLTNPGEVLVGGYNGTASGSVAFGSSTPLDPLGEGALRFTNGCINSSSHSCSSDPSGGGFSQNGAIVSADTFSTNQGLNVTFKTVTYRGNSGGANGDGADGMSFFLIDASKWSPTVSSIGSWGGSLGYTCSNSNADYHGMVGAYLGLGIDEYGNFLNGTVNTQGTPWSASGDNTASGGGYKPNRIGLRGAGNIAWSYLNATYPDDYPASLGSLIQEAAVRHTCETGDIWNYSDPDSPQDTGTSIMDYPAISGAYDVIPNKIAMEYSSGGYSRQKATPITYRLKITQDGLLSLWYSYNGGAWTGVLENQSITAQNGALPSSLRFGFGGSTGGSTNIHELLCFKATPNTQASSSGNLNQQESSRLANGTQIYLAYYDPTDWTGRLTANQITTDSSGNIIIASTAYWDASCVLTGVPAASSTSTGICASTGQSGPIAAESPSTRMMLTWSGSQGIPFEWSNLTAAEQGYLDAGDSTPSDNRLEYLRGDRSNELTSTGSGLYRDRARVLGDIVDASPAWVGPPGMTIFSAYENPSTWKDKLYPSSTMPENSNETYATFAGNESARLNVVYIGANDGFVHGFAAGSYDSSGNFLSTNNTGKEVLAYMPEGVLQDIHNDNPTQANLDYSNAQYGHNFYVDATPGTGDLFYGGAWHTWLVGGIGPGGAEIYALDVTHPSQFSESNAQNLVIGDWMATTLTCPSQTVTTCGSNLGDTYGTPVIRRLHDGHWAIIFGNGIGSSSGDAGIFIMDIDPTTHAITPYYLSAGQAGTNDGIAYVTPVDLDGDHVVDYVYAGDVNGNVWRFDLTGNTPSSWGVMTAPDSSTPMPLFTTPTGQPITSAVQPAFVTNAASNQTQLMLLFGTGEKFPITNSSPTTYASGTQSFYGVWDWNMDAWNKHNLTQFQSLSSSAELTALGTSSSTGTLNYTDLVQQSVSIVAGANNTSTRAIGGATPICWAGTTACASGDDQFGWYIDLPGINSEFSQTTYEQDVYNPTIVGPAVVFNSILAGIDSPLICTAGQDQGWTYAIDARTGGAVSDFFDIPPTTSSSSSGSTTNNGNVYTLAYESDATGTVSVVANSGYGNGGSSGGGTGGTGVSSGSSTGSTSGALVYQTITGTGGSHGFQYTGNAVGSRETWIELR